MKDRLTVLHVTSSENLSGGTVQAALLCRGLKDQGHRPVFCAPPNSGALLRAQELGLETRALQFGSVWDQWLSSRKLRALSREMGADLLHSHHTKGHNVGLLATLGGGCPPLVANRGVLFRPVMPARFKTRRTAAITTNSLRVKEVLRACGVPGEKVHVIYNAKELPDLGAVARRLPELRRELGVEGEGPVIGAVGSGRREKGFDHLVEAAPAIVEAFPGAVFVLVGSGTEKFEPRLRELGLRDRFRLPGFRRDAVEVMALFDDFVFPSVDMDSCPNVVLEAMGVGLPIVGADVGGVAEILEEGQNGILVPPGEPAALARAVVAQLRDPVAWRAAGAKGREALARVFSLETKVAGTLAVYRGLLDRAPSSRA